MTKPRSPGRGQTSPRRSRIAAATTAVLVASTLTPMLVTGGPAAAAPEGQGFALNASDLRFIFKQIEIAEHHAANPGTPEDPCSSLVGPGPNQIPDVGNGKELPLGLRTVDGSCNNVFPFPERARWGAADTIFPRLVPVKLRGGYDSTTGNVNDPEPRRISNLIVDQTASNPAAIAAAGTDVADPADHGTLPIGNVAPDAGLSAPFNSWFTLFGQFFDHGLDLVTKNPNSVVFMPLDSDDPLFVPGAPTNFMVLNRTTNQPGPDGVRGTADDVHEATNTTTSFVDQNQTYTSHPSHQVFMREYAGAAAPVETGRLLTGPGDGMATWDDVQAKAGEMLGIQLSDLDVLNVPLLATDPYGHFLRGPNVRPRVVYPAGSQPADAQAAGRCTAPANGNVLCEGTPENPLVLTNARKTGHGFLDDIAHAAVPNAAGTHNSVLLGQHFVAGDGRVNENIGLTTVHHVFHSEHNRLQGDIDSMITNFAATGLTQVEANNWRADNAGSGWGYGERLFQAARFVTEMEYQHLVFEEFARKVQPMVNIFGEEGGYHPGLNASIRAEFAHAVYRFGHSMLTETVARRSPTNVNRDIGLIEAFLNPNSFLEGGLTPEQAAGDVVRGMTRQTGNEIDEFVTEALRNNLLGLPLDLATINMARARDAGVPRLNEARRAFFAESGNTQVRPYDSWVDFGFSLKHPESLVNFVAAYGRHTTITSATTTAARRLAAARIVYGEAGPDGILTDVPETLTVDESADNLTDIPADRLEFLNSTTAAWQNTPAGVTTTGVDDIDLWMGGLAEKQMVFGGLLGPTFNYVFELQMEDLQDGDRFYYLHRLPGTNMLTQLEGNSFAELIMRNTDVEGLPADSFSRPDLVFNIGAGNTVQDNPDTPLVNETSLITTMADGTLRFGGAEHTVWNGTAGNDRIWSSEGDDTLRGNDGDDRIQGGDGNDNHVGGLGDDILQDLNGDDVMKGGADDDAISSGQGGGGDLNMGGFGNDFILGGNDITETFGGEGDDVIYAGDAEDTVFADGGDDWIEGGRGPFDQLFGDNGAIAQDDPNEAGHDVLMAEGVGEKDFDAEGGDDVMIYSTGIQRGEGMRGFDWVTHRTDPNGPLPADVDMTNLVSAVPAVPAVEANRDRVDLVEALSGAELNDILRGDDRDVTDLTAGANEPANSHVLNQAGINRIQGLAALLPAGTTSFAAGNIIIGGGGADVIEGRGGDDIINGDAQLVVELQATYDNGTVRTIQSMRQIQADVFAGLIDPGNIRIIRRIETLPGTNDTAVFSGARAEYLITRQADGTVIVDHQGGIDGIDTLRQVEQLRFTDVTVPAVLQVTVPGAPSLLSATAGVGSITVTFAAPIDNGGSPITGFRVTATPVGGGTSVTVTPAANATTATLTGLTSGTPYNVAVLAVNLLGSSLPAASGPLTPTANPSAPLLTAQDPAPGATGFNQSANLTLRFNERVQGVNGTTVRLTGSGGTTVPAVVTLAGNQQVVTVNPNANLARGTTYTVTLVGGTSAIRDLANNAFAGATWSFTTR